MENDNLGAELHKNYFVLIVLSVKVPLFPI